MKKYLAIEIRGEIFVMNDRNEAKDRRSKRKN